MNESWVIEEGNAQLSVYACVRPSGGPGEGCAQHTKTFSCAGPAAECPVCRAPPPRAPPDGVSDRKKKTQNRRRQDELPAAPPAAFDATGRTLSLATELSGEIECKVTRRMGWLRGRPTLLSPHPAAFTFAPNTSVRPCARALARARRNALFNWIFRAPSRALEPYLSQPWLQLQLAASELWHADWIGLCVRLLARRNIFADSRKECSFHTEGARDSDTLFGAIVFVVNGFAGERNNVVCRSSQKQWCFE